MRIKELIIEGFKSYPGRTQISGWDPSFNAITGLNGSGKSNILDAICFVLGMTNMTSMRAQNQQDLIYKRGQAGVTKASVTIVFDNTDRTTSPVGLENLAEITVMRQIALPNVSKYLLNGHKAQQQQIQTLFQSVQLNINNPNFLIMQGRITKVLNMRPQEILGMVEEAAGTRMFEERKDKAKKTMGKKEKKVAEITTLLTEEITPKLDTLRSEKRSFLQFQKACTELERVGRILRAYEWTEAKERAAEKVQEIKAKEKETANVQKRKSQFTQEIEAAEADIEEVAKKRDKELKKGGKLTKLQEEVTEYEKTLVKMRTQVDLKSGSIQEEESSVASLEEELGAAEEALEAKQADLARLETEHTSVQEEHARLQTELNSSEELLQTLLTGLSSSNKGQSGGGYMGQIADARQRESQGKAEEAQNRQKLTMAERSLTEVQAKWKEVEREAGEGKKRLERMRREVEQLRKDATASGWSEERERQAGDALRAAREEVRQLAEQRDRLKARLPMLDFNYSDPTPNFDRSKVKGLVANLIKLDQGNYDKATALEIVAGGRLYNVVVENEKVGKDLILNGKLRKRVTIIPLNKISGHTMSSQKLGAAKRLAGDKVRTALSLVGYDDEVARAMEHVFGDTLICDDAESAKKVTFAREVGVKSVTLQGDVYDPSGTLSGGAPPSSNHVLVNVQGLIDAEHAFRQASERLRALEQEDARTRGMRDNWKKLSHELEMKQHEMQLLEEQVGGSNATKVATDIDALKQNIQELQAAVQASLDKQKTAKEDIKKLEKDMAEFKNNKEGKIEQLKADVHNKKTALQKHSTALKLKQKEAQASKLEFDGMTEDINTAKQQIEQALKGIVILKRELGKLQDEVAATQTAFEKAERKLQDERATLTRFDSE
ncbi:hypothetical protein NM688_g1793 [Phlebia brevispora]|uniref:Uncharacterized protein n=1 Tax=Phlebia brevispora TaxID=194682 RepID=A0ACC1TAE8_9APHY|nr:hypothetical protein NM688_g1793 [Phlebia brevispora]